jgi:hypothetical protein
VTNAANATADIVTNAAADAMTNAAADPAVYALANVLADPAATARDAAANAAEIATVNTETVSSLINRLATKNIAKATAVITICHERNLVFGLINCSPIIEFNELFNL